MTPRISVIIPAYNSARFLVDAIDSVAWQSLPACELIVVDDGSTDCSAAVAAAYPGVTLIRQANKGLPGARNTGIRASTGDLIALLDADDIWLPDHLEAVWEALQQNPEAGGSYTYNISFLDSEDVVAPSWMDEDSIEKQVMFPLPSSWLIRRETFDSIGLFDETYLISEDLEWLARARRNGVAFVSVPVGTLLRRLHGSNLSYKSREIQASRFRILREHQAALRRGTSL